MKTIKIVSIVLLLITAGYSAVFGASEDIDPAAYLIYFDDPYEIEVYDVSGSRYEYVDWDMPLPEGTSISTLNSSAELELVPNGTIIKLAPNTDFIIETLQTNDRNANTFTMVSGKLRTVAARSGFGENYSIQTPSAVCGVRGTDFGLQVIPGESDAVAVLQGAVQFINITTGESLNLTGGQAADIFADVFAPIQLDPDTLASLFEPMSFTAADPQNVPGYASEGGTASTEEELEADADRIEEETTERFAESDTAESDTGTAPDSAPAAPSEPAELPGVDADFLQPMYDFLGNYFGMELGTISIDGTTYKKAVFLPKLEIGKFRMALYLPIIYNTDMFDPSDYYRPEGNDEWSFGRDQSGTLPIVSDVFRDIALKIKYIEYGDNRDTFFFKIGNSESVTLGHGFLMRKFPFDFGFPVERHLGFNLGLNFKPLGFEALIADAGLPEIMGGRLYFRPFHKVFPLALGISSIVDLFPARYITVPAGAADIDRFGDPVFITAALDLDYPFIETDPFSLVLFSDAGFMMPYYRESYEDYISPGPAAAAVMTTPGAFSFDSLNNFGFTGGVFGNVFFISYRLDYRLSKGVIAPPYFSTNYHRRRGSYVEEFASFMQNPASDDYQSYTMGIYGEVGATVGKILTVEGGYFWPWEMASGTIQPSSEDLFHLEFTLNPGVIPFVGIYGSLSFDRTHFAQTVTDPALRLFDAYTTVKGELVVPIVEVLHVALIYTTTTARDGEGNVIQSTINPELPEVTPSISIETRINF